jgi:hypothetical protein
VGQAWSARGHLDGLADGSLIFDSAYWGRDAVTMVARQIEAGEPSA